MYQYHGFGLNILSEIEIPELLPGSFEQPDVTITKNKVPDNIEGNNVVRRMLTSFNEKEFLLFLKDVCKYYVKDGNTVWIEPVEGIDDRSVRIFLLGTVLAMVLYQRNLIPLHSSGIIKDGAVILFAGDSGAGKSTTLAIMASKGYKIFTDDICVLKQEDGQVTGTASYPMMKLWEDAIDKLGEENYSREFNVRPELPKYGQFFHEEFCTDVLPVKKIFVLVANNDIKELTIRKLSPMEAFKTIESQSFRKQLITGTGLRASYFKVLTAVSQQIEVYEIKRPAPLNTLDVLYNEIEKHL